MFRSKRMNLTDEVRRGMPGSFVRLSAGVTHYELRGGSGAETVVLIHGNAAPYVTWDNTIGALSDAGFRVLRYDLFGHGLSDRPRLSRYDRRLYNEQLAELLDRVGIPLPVMVVGTSQGGSIAACFGATHPGAISRLALLAPFFDRVPGQEGGGYRLIVTPVVGDLLFGLLGDRKLADVSDSIVSADTRAALQPTVLEQYRYRGKKRAVLANLRGDALQDATSCYRSLGEQQIPMLLTYGTADRKIPRESMVRLRELLPGIEYHEIEGAGHLAHYEFADLINPILISFLRG